MGFWDGIEKGWHAFEEQFEETSENIGTALGCGVPWIILGLIVFFLIGTCAACLD